MFQLFLFNFLFLAAFGSTHFCRRRWHQRWWPCHPLRSSGGIASIRARKDRSGLFLHVSWPLQERWAGMFWPSELAVKRAWVSYPAIHFVQLATQNSAWSWVISKFSENNPVLIGKSSPWFLGSHSFLSHVLHTSRGPFNTASCAEVPRTDWCALVTEVGNLPLMLRMGSASCFALIRSSSP